MPLYDARNPRTHLQPITTAQGLQNISSRTTNVLLLREMYICYGRLRPSHLLGTPQNCSSLFYGKCNRGSSVREFPYVDLPRLSYVFGKQYNPFDFKFGHRGKSCQRVGSLCNKSL
ncbi:hypothetical protein Goari_003577 [Gossypium aridum]|uniref:Uncharacterized protein n=1 Tax=Gossypium aridum TaxID=34290 RepID=A0A7J8YDK0_GOSAI|nr:hypothetical protein [Gossypium aridum]